MAAKPPCRLDDAGDTKVLRLAGDWRMPHLASLDGALARVLDQLVAWLESEAARTKSP